MSIIDTLSISLTARTEKWSKGLSKARRDLSSFGRSVQRSSAGIVGFGAALVGVGSVAGLGAFVKRQADAVEETGAFAGRLRAATEELVALRFAAGQSEVDVGTFDAAMQRLVKNTNDASKGTGKAKDAFADLGIDAKKFAALPLEEKMLLLADRFSQMSDGGRAAADAMALFGKGGAPLLQLLNQGPEGVKQLTDQARALGLTFSALDASKVDDASDAVGRLQAVFTGLGQRAAIALAPEVEAIADGLTKAALSGAQFGATTTPVFERIALGMAKVLDISHLLSAVWYGFKSIVEGVAGIALEFIAQLGFGLDKVVKSIPGLQRLVHVKRGEFEGTQELARQFAQKSIESAAARDKAGAAFANGETSAAVARFFDGLAAKVDAGGGDFGSTPGTLPEAAGRAAGDPFAARQLNLANVFVGALAASKRERQDVSDEGSYGRLDRINNTLKRMSMGAVTV